MVTKVLKDIIGALFMALGVVFTLGCAAAGMVTLFEEDNEVELAFVPKKDKEEKK